MKFTTEICEVGDCTWKWTIKFLDYGDNKCIKKELPRYKHHNVTFNDCIVEGYGSNLEETKTNLNEVLNTIKYVIIVCKKEKKQKELEAVGQKLWEWDDSSNDFKRVK